RREHAPPQPDSKARIAPMDVAVNLKPLRVALVGVPNCGKTALFNRLTGSRQQVANYPGVTVERREGDRAAAGGRTPRVLDLPATVGYSPPVESPWFARLDAVLLHPLSGLAILIAVLFVMFQAVFSWAVAPMDLIKAGMATLGEWTAMHLPPGPIASLLVNGVI